MTAGDGSPRLGSRRFQAAMILGGVFLVLLLLGAAFLFAFKRQITASFLRSGAMEALGSTSLPAPEQERVMASLERVLALFERGELDDLKMTKLMEAFNDSPVSKWFLIARVKGSHLEPSTLPEEEKQKGRTDLDRLLRGLVEGKITSEELETATRELPRRKDLGGMLDFDHHPSEAELRKFLAGVASLVDAKAIPAERLEIDIAAEAERIVDQALGETGAGEREH